MYLSTPRKNKKRKYNTFIFIISSDRGYLHAKIKVAIGKTDEISFL
jgi:hypothetical protein